MRTPIDIALFSRLLLRSGLLLSLLCWGLASGPAFSQPGPGPGPGGGGPGDPPRSTPGLDPVTLTGLAAAGYVGFKVFKSRNRR